MVSIAVTSSVVIKFFSSLFLSGLAAAAYPGCNLWYQRQQRLRGISLLDQRERGEAETLDQGRRETVLLLEIIKKFLMGVSILEHI